MIPGSREWVLVTKRMLDGMSLPQLDLMSKASEPIHYSKALKKYSDEVIEAEYKRRGLDDKRTV